MEKEESEMELFCTSPPLPTHQQVMKKSQKKLVKGETDPIKPPQKKVVAKGEMR